MQCVKNLDDVFSSGNYNTPGLDNLVIVFEKCDPKKASSKCADETIINNFLKSKYILTVENQKRFIQHKFTADRINEGSELHWYAINPDQRTDFVNIITQTHINLNDDVWSFKNDDEVGFFITEAPVRTLPYDNRF